MARTLLQQCIVVGVRDSEDDDDDGKTKEECEMIARLLDGRWVERKTDRLSSVLPNRESPQFFLFFLSFCIEIQECSSTSYSPSI